MLAISAASYRRASIALILVLSALSLGGVLSEVLYGQRFGGLVRLLNVDEERSLPTWYSVLAIALSAALLAAVSAVANAREDRFAWRSLTALFALISLDEAIGVHESVGKQLRLLFDLKGILYFGWVLPALVIVPLLGAIYLRFLGRLTARRRVQFIAAGAIFVGGALGMELLGPLAWPSDWTDGQPLPLAYVAVFHLEEFLEMLGIVLFNAALIEELAAQSGGGGLVLRFSARSDV